MVFVTYRKNLKKSWMIGMLPPAFVTLFVPLIASIWPEFEAQAELLSELLRDPTISALFGQWGIIGMDTWEKMFLFYIFIWIEYVMCFISIFWPITLISSEVEHPSLDFVLSYPIPRWKYLLEKFGVYMSYNLLYFILILPLSYISTEFYLQETLNYTLVVYALIGVYAKLFALGAIGLLCAVMFLRFGRSAAAAAVIILGMLIGNRMAELSDALQILGDLSLFTYVSAPTIYSTGEIPLNELILVLVVGSVILSLSLWLFRHKDLTF